MTDLIETFEAMLVVEPDLRDIADRVMVDGRVLRRRRRRIVLTTAVAVAAVVGAAVVVPLTLEAGKSSSQTLSSRVTHPRTVVPGTAANNYPAQATAALCRAGLRPLYVSAAPITGADESVNGYAVRAISPAPGQTVPAGSTVTLTLAVSVNGGPPSADPLPTAVVPNVKGLNINTALNDLTRANVLVNVTVATPTGSLRVTSETPAPGSIVGDSATVTLKVGDPGSQGCRAGN
ncbi:MAG TPA: PASTA domain-containing protein [Mycobacteriales bacterium]|nr:PASTA domain-containing protein [Mycobacteriales bacterium]